MPTIARIQSCINGSGGPPAVIHFAAPLTIVIARAHPARHEESTAQAFKLKPDECQSHASTVSCQWAMQPPVSRSWP